MKLQLAAVVTLMLGTSGCGSHWVLRKDARKQAFAPRPPAVALDEPRAVGDVLVLEKRDGPGMADYFNATTVIVASVAERDRARSLLTAVFPDVMGEPAGEIRRERKQKKSADPLLDTLEALPRLPKLGSLDAPRIKTVDEYLADLRMGCEANKAAYAAAHPGAAYAWNDELDYAAERRKLKGLLRGQRAVVLRYVHVQTARSGR